MPGRSFARTFSLVFTAAVICSALLSACTTQKPAAKAPDPCADMMCTDIFKSVTVKVVDGSGRPVRLKMHATNAADRSSFTTESMDNPDEGIYTIVDDGAMQKIRNSKATVYFDGSTADGKSVREKFTIGADCCHIYKDSGPDVITVR